jgi:hypothetical protein
MKDIANNLLYIIEQYTPLLQQISEATFSAKPSPNKWSKKETLGHLLDSAQNNARRFVVAQYEDKPYIVYKQDFWVAAANYQAYETKELVALWSLFNKHIFMLLHNMPESAGEKICVSEAEHALKWLAEDYIKHTKHHLHQVIDLEPFPYS